MVALNSGLLEANFQLPALQRRIDVDLGREQASRRRNVIRNARSIQRAPPLKRCH
jgi:hypothetical protein